MELDEKVLLFDPPSRGFLPKELWKQIRKMIRERELYTFISHGHGDHFTPKVTELESTAGRTHHIVSNDVPLHGKNAIRLDKDEERLIDDSFLVKTFESNDEGVAFLIDIDKVRIYYGGDLAKWDWPEWTENERREHIRMFENTIKKLKKVDIAFSNCDPRLESMAGPVDFIKHVRPRYFVPMHTFGRVEIIKRLDQRGFPDTSIFSYSNSGDEMTMDI